MKKKNYFLGILFIILPIFAYLMISTIVSTCVQVIYIAKIYMNGIPSYITDGTELTVYLTEELLKTDYTGCATFFADLVGAIVAFFWMRSLKNYDLPCKNVFNIKRVIGLISFGIFIQIASGLLINFVFMLLPTEVSESYTLLAETLTGDETSVFMFLAVVIMAPVCEEFFLRGLALQYGRKYMSDTLSVILTSVAFGLIHLSNVSIAGISGTLVQVVYACVYGVLLAVVRIKFKTVWSSVLVHFSINGFGEIISLFLNDTDYGMLVMVIVMIFSAVLSVLLYKKAGVPTEKTVAEIYNAHDIDTNMVYDNDTDGVV